MAPRIPRGSSANLRTKVVALLVSLTALWVFAAWVTLREGTNLLFAQALNVYVYEPSEPLLQGLQDERRLSLAYLGAPKAAGTELDAARTNTRNLAAEFRQSAQGRQADVAGSSELKRRVGATVVQLDELDTIRTQVDARTIDRGAAAAAYTDVVDGIFRVYDALGSLDDETIATQAAALIDLNRQYELISQEDALVTGILSAGRITPAESAEVAKLVGAQRFMGIKTVSDLERRDRARYDEMLAGDAFVRLHGSEDRLILGTRTGTAPPIKLADWQGVVEPALQQLHDVVVTGGDGIVERSTPGAIWVIVRILLAAVLGAFAVIASVIVSVTTARALVAQLERLREAARTLANERLPGVVERLGRGRTWTSPPRHRRWTSATTRSARWGRRSTRSRRPRSVPRSSRPSCGAAYGTSSSASPGVPRHWSTASSSCSTRWSAGRTTPRSWRTCSGSTTWPPGCGVTPRT